MTSGTSRAAEHPYVLFSVGGQRFGTPVEQVSEVIDVPPITRVPGAPSFVLGLMNLRGRVLPVLDAALRLAIPPAPRPGRVLIAAHPEGGSFGVRVDDASQVVVIPVGSVRQTPEAAVGDAMRKIFRGVATLDGEVLVLCDLFPLLPRGSSGVG